MPINSVDDINADSIRAVLRDTPIRTKQTGISIPMVKRYYSLLVENSPAPAIRVYENIIIDGNHRYVAGILFGKIPQISPATPTTPWLEDPIIEWGNINYDPNDWG